MFVCVGVNTLAYGHYAITRKVTDGGLIEGASEDTVLSAAEAREKLIRPGRPWPHMFPLGEEPVSATRATDRERLEAAQLRVRAVQAQLQAGQLPTSRSLNLPVVNAVVNAVLDEHYRGAIDLDFDADDIVALHEVAVNFRNNGLLDRKQLRDQMINLCAALREMIQEEQEEQEDGNNGEVEEDEE